MTAARWPAAAAYRGAPVLVLGGTGFLGAWVAHALAAAGAHVHVTVRDRARLDAVTPRVTATPHDTDLTRAGAVRRLLETIQPVTVFNLAGYGVDRRERDPALMQALNHDLVVTLCDALDAAGPATRVRLVHVGSALEYGPVRARLDEHTTPQPSTDYGRTKLAGTIHAARWSAGRREPMVLARLFNVYGPGEHEGRLFPSILALANGDTLDLTSGRQPRDFAWIEDIVDGLLRLAARPPAPGECVHLASGRLTSVRAFAEEVARAAGVRPEALRFGALPDREEEMWHGEVDIARLRALTGWSPGTSVAEGVQRSRELTHAG